MPLPSMKRGRFSQRRPSRPACFSERPWWMGLRISVTSRGTTAVRSTPNQESLMTRSFQLHDRFHSGLRSLTHDYDCSHYAGLICTLISISPHLRQCVSASGGTFRVSKSPDWTLPVISSVVSNPPWRERTGLDLTWHVNDAVNETDPERFVFLFL